MTLDDLKKEFKTSYEFRKRTGMSHANWTYWCNKVGYIPIVSQLKIERLTEGKLKASLEDVPHE